MLRTSIRPPPLAESLAPLARVVVLELAVAEAGAGDPDRLPPTTIWPFFKAPPLLKLLAMSDVLPSAVLLTPEMLMVPPSACSKPPLTSALLDPLTVIDPP